MTGAARVALVGAGYWGSRLARNLAQADGCELRYVCDLDAARAHSTAEAYASRATTSLDDVLADASVDALVVATPAATHGALVAAAVEAGLHLLVEKPLAGSSAAVLGLAERAQGAGVIIMCDQTYRFAAAVPAIRDIVSAPDFGPVRQVDLVRTNCGHEQPDLDVFWDLAYHDVSILDAVLPGGLGDDVEVRAELRDGVGLGRPHQGDLALHWASGLRAVVRVDWHGSAKTRTLHLAGDDQEVTWDDVTSGRGVRHRGRAVPLAADREPLAGVVAEFLAAIAQGRPASCGPAQELRVLAVLEAATASAALGGEPRAVAPMASPTASTAP
jgi:predicted dehydrogenase